MQLPTRAQMGTAFASGIGLGSVGLAWTQVVTVFLLPTKAVASGRMAGNPTGLAVVSHYTTRGGACSWAIGVGAAGHQQKARACVCYGLPSCHATADGSAIAVSS